MGKYSSLRDIAQAASQRHDGAHGRRLGRVAEKAGLVLSYTTVDKILAGTYMSRPDTKTLDALSTLSGVPRVEVYRAAGEPLPLAPLAEVLPQDADLLTAHQRRVVLGVIREFAKAERAKHERKTSDDAAKPTTAKGRGQTGRIEPPRAASRPPIDDQTETDQPG